METQLLTVDEAAALLRMTPARLVRLANRGGIPRIVLPDNELRFDSSELDKWLVGFRLPAKGAAH